MSKESMIKDVEESFFKYSESQEIKLKWLIDLARNKLDEVESLSAAHNDLQKEVSILKSENKKLYDDKNLIHDRLMEVESARQELFKRNERLTKRSNQMGKDLLWAKNKLRENGDERWKLLNKKVRHAQSKF